MKVYKYFLDMVIYFFRKKAHPIASASLVLLVSKRTILNQGAEVVFI